jgi:hypothetical protein
LKFEGKVSRALQSQRIKLEMPNGKPSQQQDGKSNSGTTIVRRTENRSTREGAIGEETGVEIEKLRKEYQSILDVAFDTMGGEEGLAEAVVDDEKLGLKPNWRGKC